MADVLQGSKYTIGLNFKNFSIHLTLLQEVKRCWIKLLSTRSWQNFKTAEKKLNSVSKYLYFSCEIPEYKENTFFTRTYPVRLLLKLSYWNKSMQKTYVIITTNEYHKQPPTIIEKLQRRHLWGWSVISKKLISHFDMNVCCNLTAFVLKLQQKNLRREKSIVWKTA